ncbi:Autotransporter beta-domain containing protein [Methylophilaceae bacterium]
MLWLVGLLVALHAGQTFALCNSGNTVTSTINISASCAGGNVKGLTLDTGANVTIDLGVTVSNDAGSGSNGRAVVILSSTTSANLINNGTIYTWNQWGLWNQTGGNVSVVNFGHITAGVRYGIANQGTITSLTNIGSITGPFSSISNGTPSGINVFNNLQGQNGLTSSPVTIAGYLPLNYNIIINSPTEYGQLSSSASPMAFDIYGGLGTTLISGVNPSTLSVGTYSKVLQGISSLAAITGTTGIYGGFSYSLVVNPITLNAWDLLVALRASDISGVGTSYLFSNLGSSLNPRFDGGILKADNTGSILSNFTITTNNGEIDQNANLITIAGAIADDALGVHGKLILINTGTPGQGSVTLSGINTHSGGIEVEAGANLKIASSSALGTGTLALVGTTTVSATLSTTADMTISNPITVAYDPTFNVASGTTTTISSIIADGGVAGDVVVEGGGTLALTNVNTYTGPTTIATGSTLTLSGSGSIATTSSVTNNGNFNIAAKTTDVTLGGSYTQASTGTLTMRFAPSGTQKLIVTGATNVAGGLAFNAVSGSYSAGKYTLLASGGLTGTFSSLDAASLAPYTNLGYYLSYDTNNVYFTLTPNLAQTQNSISNNLVSLQGLYNLQTSVINNGLSYDCSLFDTRGLCISTGGRYSNTNTPTGDSTGALVIGSYRVNDHVRVGLYLDQGISSSMPTGIHLQQHNPLFGAFGVWQASEDGLGAQVKVAAGYNDADMTVTRTVIGTSEAGSGSTNLTSKAISVVGSYGVEMQGSWIASPYAGARYTNVKADGYTEATDSAVTAPLSYATLEQSAVSLLAGIRWYGKLTDRVALNGSVGVEHDVDNRHANYTATGITGLTPTVFNNDINKTRAVASVGATVSIDKIQQLAFSVMYREEAFSHSSTTSAYGTYTIGF